MPEAYIVDAARTPTGRRKGGLAHVHGADLGAHAIKAVVERNAIPDNEYDDVVFGCVMQVGEQAVNVARNAVLAAGWPQEVTGVTLNRFCGSGQQAVNFGAMGLRAGFQDLVVTQRFVGSGQS